MKTMVLFSSVLVACGRLYAQTPDELRPSLPEPSPETVADSTLSPSIEPVTDLPHSPGPTIESITLFPNQGEIPSGGGFNDQRFGYVLHGQLSAQYDSNIFISPTNETSDFIFAISPGAAVGFGDFKSNLIGADAFRYRFERLADQNYFYVSYSPTIVHFLENTDQDSVNQNAKIEGEWSFQKLTVGVRAGFQTLNASSEDIGGRVESQRLSAAIISRYQLTGKTALEFNAYYEGVNYSGDYVDAQEWRGETWLNYQIMPKTTVAFGLVYGHLERSPGPTDNFEEAQVRVQYQPSEKLSVGLVAGPEFRQTEGAGDQTNGVFSLFADWTPTDSSMLTLEAYNRVLASGAVGENYTATGVRLQYRQRLFQRLFFDLSGGYQHSKYDGDAEAGREDDLYFVRLGFGFGLTSWMTCEVTGEFRSNDSTDFQRSFDATRATVIFNVLF